MTLKNTLAGNIHCHLFTHIFEYDQRSNSNSPALFPKELLCYKPNDIEAVLTAVTLITPLLNALPNVVFFIKDLNARYLVVNQTLAKRCGFKSVEALLGKTSAEVFPRQMGHRYTEQDLQVLKQGIVIHNQLEIHFYQSRQTGWCMTHKLPLYDNGDRIIGMAGISLDLTEIKTNHLIYQELAKVDQYIRKNYERNVRLKELITLTGLSLAQLERYCKRIFHLTPRQMIHKARIEHAVKLLTTNLSITDIALQCGYADHSAFSRQFKLIMGLTPRDFRYAASVN